jgi:hypothetical protein
MGRGSAGYWADLAYEVERINFMVGCRLLPRRV